MTSTYEPPMTPRQAWQRRANEHRDVWLAANPRPCIGDFGTTDDYRTARAEWGVLSEAHREDYFEQNPAPARTDREAANVAKLKALHHRLTRAR